MMLCAGPERDCFRGGVFEDSESAIGGKILSVFPYEISLF
jgi:hypothetical protein